MKSVTPAQHQTPRVLEFSCFNDENTAKLINKHSSERDRSETTAGDTDEPNPLEMVVRIRISDKQHNL